MKKKILFLLLDGLGDVTYEELDGKTPLEYADTPTFDKLASNGKCGILTMDALGKEVPVPSASLMLFSVLGYDVLKFPEKRGLVEAVGAGHDVRDGELWIRCNFATVDDKWTIKDIRAGRIKNTQALVASLNQMKFVAPFEFKPGVHYRGLLVFKTKMPLSDAITPVDPHEVNERVEKCEAKNPRDEDAKYSAYLVNEFMEHSYELLNNHPFNKGRACPANFLLMRGFGSHLPRLKPFKEQFGFKACGLTGLDVNKGILKLCGIDIINTPEETGDDKKEFEIKRAALEKVLKLYDFIFVHFKGPDVAGHNGDVREKIKQIKLIDDFVGSLDLTDKIVVVTADHRTPCSVKGHAKGSVPALISPWPAGKQKERQFAEKYCTDFRIRPFELMKIVKQALR